MIPYQLALLGWIPFCALLMLDRKPARALSLAVVAGMMILPARQAVTIIGLPDFTKGNVTALGLFLGTLMFHPDLVLKFRPRASDALLVLMLVLAVATSVTNNFGLYDGLSVARTQAFAFMLPIFLARIHLNTPRALLTFLTTLLIGSVIYTLPAVWEFRMSPQLHTHLYGYFQHSFVQFRRGSFFRPVVCFPHALTLGRFMAFAAFLALIPLRGYLGQRFPGGRYYFAAPLFSLLLSMSWGPYLMFLGLGAIYFIAKKWIHVVYLLPLAAGLWIVLVLAGARPLYGVVDSVASLNPSRAESLKYRLDALEEYRVAILSRPGLGHGGWGNARTERATDSAVLITSLARGLTGAVALFGWWAIVMHNCCKLARRIRDTPLANVFLSIGILLAICMAICAVDDALDHHTLFLAGSVLAIERVMRGAVIPAAVIRRPHANRPASTGPVYVYN